REGPARVGPLLDPQAEGPARLGQALVDVHRGASAIERTTAVVYSIGAWRRRRRGSAGHPGSPCAGTSRHSGVRRLALAVRQVVLILHRQPPLWRRGGGSRRERREAADDLRAVAGGIGEEEQAVAEGVDERLVDRGAGLAERLGHRVELVPVDDEREVVGI